VNETLVLLLLVWAALYLPGVIRARNTSPHVTVGGFERAMNVLRSDGHDRGGGRHVMVPADPARIVARPVDDRVEPAATVPVEDPVIARRRVWFIRSLAACALTLVLAVVVQGVAWLGFLAVVSATVAYAAVLRRLKQQRDEARSVVRQLDLRGGVVEDAGQVAVGAEDAWVGSGAVRLRRWDG
jgi:hypothetical protein